MPGLDRSELVSELSTRSAADIRTVDAVLNALAQVAIETIAEGVLLPGIGELKLSQSPEREIRIPTGQTVIQPGRPELAFEPDSWIRSVLLGNVSVVDSPREPVPPKSLPELRLNPYSDTERAEPSTATSKTKIGGAPDWIQLPEVPTCCGQQMYFYGQFDSSIGEPYDLVDAGMLYVFVCEHCSRPHASIQYY
ncbi:HU family DNA-binding protein [Stieleria varia]|uniref:Bacterial DNA-binding protein n=1 Tax=Stieleria varia TaxID=2528005 RepID=A0A5C6AM09_9BACT|nr:hypothetical protein Pla52n_44650 [Stieleria varia]